MKRPPKEVWVCVVDEVPSMAFDNRNDAYAQSACDGSESTVHRYVLAPVTKPKRKRKR